MIFLDIFFMTIYNFLTNLHHYDRSHSAKMRRCFQSQAQAESCESHLLLYLTARGGCGRRFLIDTFSPDSLKSPKYVSNGFIFPLLSVSLLSSIVNNNNMTISSNGSYLV